MQDKTNAISARGDALDMATSSQAEPAVDGESLFISHTISHCNMNQSQHPLLCMLRFIYSARQPELHTAM